MAKCRVCTGLPLYIYTGQLFRKYMATENFGKLSGDRNIQGDRYIMTGLVYKGLDCIISYTKAHQSFNRSDRVKVAVDVQRWQRNIKKCAACEKDVVLLIKTYCFFDASSLPFHYDFLVG